MHAAPATPPPRPPVARRLLRPLFAVAVVAAGLLAVSVPPASAVCECAEPVRSTDTEAGAVAFVGTFVELTDGFWQFEVEEWLTEDRGSAIGVVSDSTGECGLSLGRGDRVAVYATADPEGTPTADMCSIGDPEAALASLEPLAIHPDAGEAHYLIGPGNGPPHYWLVDSVGRVAGFVRTPDLPSSQLEEVSLCPGARHVVELWEDRVIVRDLTTLAEQSTIGLPPLDDPYVGYERIICRSGDGSDVLVGRQTSDSPISLAIADLVSVDAPTEPVITGPFRSLTTIDPDTALVSVNLANTRLEVLDLETGTSRLLDEARDIEEPVVAPPVINEYAVSPDGSRVAFSIRRELRGQSNRIDTFVWEISPGNQIAAYREPPSLETSKVWLGNDRLITTDREDGTKTVVDALSGADTDETPPSVPGPYLVTDDSTIAVDGSRMVALDDGRAVTVAQFRNEFLEGPVELRSPVEVTADLPVAVTPPTTPLATTEVETDADQPESAAGPLLTDEDDPPGEITLRWAVVGIIAGCAIVGGTLLVSRRLDDQPDSDVRPPAP